MFIELYFVIAELKQLREPKHQSKFGENADMWEARILMCRDNILSKTLKFKVLNMGKC